METIRRVSTVKYLVDTTPCTRVLPEEYVLPLQPEKLISSSHVAIPMIDLSGLDGSIGRQRMTVEAIGSACPHWGFFKIISHGVKLSLMEEMLKVVDGFFNLAAEEKMNYASEDVMNPVRWSAIAAKVPGRTDNEIKNHWHTHLKKRLYQNQSTVNPGKIDEQSTNGVQSATKNRRGFAPKEIAEDPDLSQALPIQDSSSSSEISNLSCDCALLPCGMNSVMIEDISSSIPVEPIAESTDDFWTQTIFS
ncbi:hypothetical protein RHSIM_Rhsim04G0061600 [Rhododendron simsii]|uniref:Uncharacterized protein n=1 Tax=Rhododendron simsii TaxID=118357 RepID=A0A834LS89_RHOSS|nr:hypothetical protein RHSIM_Rhsim04G0061600 [Rhododendron simsii]